MDGHTKFDDGNIDLIDLAERVAFIAPKVGRLRGDRIVRVDPNDPIAVSKARAAIADRYHAMEQRRWTATPAEATSRGINRVARKRIADLELYLWRRYGRQVPDDDAGLEDLVLLLHYVARNRVDPRAKMLASIRVWASWMRRDDAEALADKVLERPRKYKSTTLGRILRLTRDEAAEIATIRPFDVTDAEMAEVRKRSKRDWNRADRTAKSSGRPRGRPKSKGPAPWEAAGASSKATHYRNRKKAAVCETKNRETKNAGTPYKKSYGVPGIAVSPQPDSLADRCPPSASSATAADTITIRS